ncbi:MAG: DUF4145 domain-containing protein [Spirosomataceae bacterium]
MTEKIRTYCYKCDNTTNQTVIFTDAEIITSDFKIRNEEGDEQQTIYSIIGKRWIVSKCDGCEGFNLQVKTKGFGDVPPIDVFTYPKKVIRQIPKWITDLPIRYVELFREVYSAINNELLTLALMGSRTIIETFIVEKIGDNGSFKRKLEKLADEGYISKKSIDVLYEAIDAGNSAAHRGFKPDTATLNDVLDIVEHLLQNTIIERQGKNIGKTIPKRGK